MVEAEALVEIISVIGVILIFIIIMIIFSRENLDYIAYAVGFTVIACIITSYAKNPSLAQFIEKIQFNSVIFIISMQILVILAEKHKIFEWIAVKALYITKGNPRSFFYLILVLSTLTAAIIGDVTVVLIFVPLIIRACRILKIEPAPYLFGITITINIGSLLTPFSSAENVIIANSFNRDFGWFIKSIGGFVLVTLFLTIFLLDVTLLRKAAQPTPETRQILLEIMNPKLVIINRRQLILNTIYFGTIVLGFFIFSRYSFLIALFGAILMSLLNKTLLTENIMKIDLRQIFFLLSLFLLIGCMDFNGIFESIIGWASFLHDWNIFLIAILVLLASSFLSGFFANTPVTMLFIALIMQFYATPSATPDVIIVALLLGVNLGGNLLPQSASSDVVTLNLAVKSNVQGFTYKSLFKIGGIFAILHNLLCVLYLLIYSAISGIL